MMAAGITGRVDILKLLFTDDEATSTLADLLGYAHKPSSRVGHTFVDPETPSRREATGSQSKPSETLPSETSSLKPATFWRVASLKLEKPLLKWQPSRKRSGKVSDTYQRRDPIFVPLSSTADVAASLKKDIALPRPSNRIDVERLTDAVSQGSLPSRIPTYIRRTWGSTLTILVDRSRHLVPYWRDQAAVLNFITKYLPPQSVSIAVCDERGLNVPLEAESLLVLSDLGALVQSTSFTSKKWDRLAIACRKQGVACSVVAPCCLEDIPRSSRALWNVIPAEESKRVVALPSDRTAAIRRLAALLSFTVRLDWGLLRGVRRLLPETQRDPAVESLLAQSEYVCSRHASAGTWNRDLLRQLETERLAEPIELRQTIHHLYEQFRDGLYPGVRYAEIIGLEREIPAGLITRAEWETAAQWITQQKGTTLSEQQQWMRDALAQMPESAMQHSSVSSELHELFQELHKEDDKQPHNTMVPGGMGGEDRDIEQIPFFQSGTEIIIGSSEPLRGSRLGQLVTRNHQYKIMCWNRLERYTYPNWATRHGSDEYGHWAEFDLVVPNPEYERQMEELSSFRHPDLTPEYVEEYLKPGLAEPSITVTQRLRWIPPGKFLMGSPEDEEGRWDDEGPQHEEVTARGFWMFETPVTQALWQAVIGEDPSHFQGVERPVETVSWEMARDFIEQLNAKVEGLELRLPQEADWEYACRAGTTGPRYHDDLEQIAWHLENSGEETHPVKQKLPNEFGLYDMLGNVWEWCEDEWRRQYEKGLVVDPEGPEEGAYRVARGGSWNNVARYVRSAYRSWDTPEDGDDVIGFRCVEFESGAQSSQSGERAVGVSEGAAEAAPQKGDSDRTPASGGAWLNLTTPGSHTIELPDVDVIQIQTDLEIVELERLPRPRWAKSMGRDRYGLWADVEVEGMTFKLRWIPPGRFMMGSPEDEAGRLDREGPQHEELIPVGFWMFETPVTQELWEAVMGENPSYFKSSQRPVETVSWEDCHEFISKLNARLDGLELTLPCEAQWEYACRAGTTTSTYAGELEIIGTNNGPLLDEIAWYEGNCGVDFDLDDGWDTSDWDEKQYEFDQGGTRAVKQKLPNPFGLYDMLGNVYEWCGDHWRSDYEAEPDSTVRVFRGGSWSDSARVVRSADRFRFTPEGRNSYIGFRCVEFKPELQPVQSPSAQQSSAARETISTVSEDEEDMPTLLEHGTFEDLDDPDLPYRNRFLKKLRRLNRQDLDALMRRVDARFTNMTWLHGNKEKFKALIDWAEGPEGSGLADVAHEARDLFGERFLEGIFNND